MVVPVTSPPKTSSFFSNSCNFGVKLPEKGMSLSAIETEGREGRLDSIAAASPLGENAAKLFGFSKASESCLCNRKSAEAHLEAPIFIFHRNCLHMMDVCPRVCESACWSGQREVRPSSRLFKDALCWLEPEVVAPNPPQVFSILPVTTSEPWRQKRLCR